MVLEEIVFWVTLPPGLEDLTLLKEAAGLAEPLLDLRYGSLDFQKDITQKAVEQDIKGLTVLADWSKSALTGFLLENLPADSRIILTSAHQPAAKLQRYLEDLKKNGITAGIEVDNQTDARQAVMAGADFLVTSGNEAYGPVSSKTSLILIQELLDSQDIPLVIRGSLGPQGAAAALIAGCSGCILDSQLLLIDSSPLNDDFKKTLMNLSPSDSMVVGALVSHPYRGICIGSRNRYRGLVDAEKALFLDSTTPYEKKSAFEEAIKPTIIQGFSEDRGILPVGQGLAFSQEFAEKNLGIREVLEIYKKAYAGAVLSLKKNFSLSAGAPLACVHNTRYPVVQGPMARISGNPRLAAEVAKAGALPFVAAGGLSPDKTRRLLQETRSVLGDKPFGVGIIGFSPLDKTLEQMDAVLESHPDFITIAGGNPAMARRFEKAGIGAYLHAPTLAHVIDFLDNQVRGIILEGREAGGHVGALGSLVLWELGIREIMTHNSESIKSTRLLLAGGIANARGALAAAALAAPLADRETAFGLQLGTAYLMTDEVVESDAVSPEYSRKLLNGHETIITGQSVNLPSQWLVTPDVRKMIEIEFGWEKDGLPLHDRKQQIERLNSDCMKAAVTGRKRAPEASENGDSLHQPAYLCGQIISVQHQPRRIIDLHEELTTGAKQLAESCLDCKAAYEPPEDAIAIIGMGCIFPSANNPGEYWENILNRISAIREVPEDRWDPDIYYASDRSTPDKTYSKIGAFVEGFEKDPLKFRIPPVSTPFIDIIQFMVLEATHQALEDAGYLEKNFPRKQTGVFVGNSGGGDLRIEYALRAHWGRFADTLESVEEFKTLDAHLKDTILYQTEKAYKQKMPEFSEDTCAGIFGSLVAGRISNCFNFGGSSYVLDGACASSLAALEAGVTALRDGRLDLALAGGADVRVDAATYLLFSSLGAISNNGSFPFDERADGFVLGEGAGMVLLKRLDDALRDGDKIYSVIRSIGSASDGRVKGITAPDVNGQISTFERAYRNVPFSPETIALIEAHGTGTWAGDTTEIKSLTRFMRQYSDKKQFIGLGSVKSMIGHLKAAAGIAGLIKLVLAIHNKVLPPTINCEQPRKDVDWENSPFYLLTEPRPWEKGISPRRAALNAFGFGGINYTTILEEAPGTSASFAVPAKTSKVQDQFPAELLIFRAATRAEVIQLVKRTREDLIQGKPTSLRQIAADLLEKIPPSGPTLAIVAADTKKFISHLDKAREVLCDETRPEFTSAQGIYFNETPLGPDEKVAFLFPGQGSQYVEMGGDLPACFPFVGEIFHEVDAISRRYTQASMLPILLPDERVSEKEKARRSKLLTRPDCNHPAMMAMGMGLLEILRRSGIRPDMVAGHSLGEYFALHAAGVFDGENAISAITSRGCDITRHSQDGAMASVSASEEMIQDLLEETPGFVTVANRNCPAQTVIAGDVKAIENVMVRVEKEGISCMWLPVSTGFHTPLLSNVVKPFRKFLDSLKINPPCLPVQSNLTGRAYEVDDNFPVYLRDTLANHLIRPVNFINNVLSMYEAGARLFVEVGPGSTLCSFVDNILVGKPYCTVSTNRPRRSATLQLIHALAFCAAQGLPVDIREIMPLPRKRKVLRRTGNSAIVKRPEVQVPSKAETIGTIISMEEILPDQNTDTVKNYIKQRGDFIKEMLHLDFRHFNKTSLMEVKEKKPVDDDIEKRVLELIALKTGYPSDAIDIDMDLEAELGIDSIKQVEIIRELARRFNIDFGEDPKSQRYMITTLRRLIEQIRILIPGKQILVLEAKEKKPVDDDIEKQVLELIALKTGYPSDAIDIDMDLEAELGIDSIKQVEIIRELARRFDIDFGEDPKSQRYMITTLHRLIDQIRILISDKASGKLSGPSGHIPEARTSVKEWNTDCCRWVCEKIEVPLPTEKNPQALKGSHVLLLAMEDGPGVLLKSSLEETGAIVSAISPSDSPEDIPEDFDLVLNLWAYAENDVPTLENITRWWEQVAHRASAMLRIGQKLSRLMQKHGSRPALWVEITSLGGGLGSGDINSMPARAGIGLGISRCLRSELSGNLEILNIDFAPEEPVERSVDRIIAELTHKRQHAEIGYTEDKRFEIHWKMDNTCGKDKKFQLNSQSVVLAIGGARGITAVICRELARNSGAKFIVVGKSPFSMDDCTDVDELITFEAARQRVLEASRAQGKRIVPTEIDGLSWKRVWEVERCWNMNRLRSTAGKVAYIQCDITVAEDIRLLVENVRREYGRIDLVVQGGGGLVEKSIDDFNVEEFIAGMKSKALGTACLLAALSDVEVGAFINLSSIAGRWGNMGQTAYAAGHEVASILVAGTHNKHLSRIFNIFFGAWLGVGMIRIGDSMERFHEKGGSFITEKAGAEFFLKEFENNSGRSVAFCGKKRIKISGRSPCAKTDTASRVSLLDHVEIVGPGIVEGRRLFDLRQDRIVAEHYVGHEYPILPGVVSLEMIAQTASVLTAPEYEVTDLENMDFPKAGKFPRGEPREFYTRVHLISEEADGVWFAGKVFSLFTPPGSVKSHEIVHAKSKLRFGHRKAPQKPSLLLVSAGFETCRVNAQPLWKTSALKLRLGIYQNIHSFSSVTRNGVTGEILARRMQEFGERPLLGNPILLDAMVSLISLSSGIFQGNMSQFVGGVKSATIFASDDPGEMRFCRCLLRKVNKTDTVSDIEAMDSMGQVVERLTGVRKVMAKPGDAVDLPEPIWDSMRENPRQTDIRRFLDINNRFVLAHIRISPVAGALKANEDRLLKEQLSEKEVERYKSMAHMKRRLEWLAGRIAVKGAVLIYLDSTTHLPSAVQVESSPANAPYIVIDEESTNFPCPHVSISHSGDMAVAVAAQNAGIGIDVEELSGAFFEIADEFSAHDEIDRVRRCTGLNRFLTLANIWSVKEAARKAIGPETCTMKELILEEVHRENDYIISKIIQPDGNRIKSVSFQDSEFVYAVSRSFVSNNSVTLKAE